MKRLDRIERNIELITEAQRELEEAQRSTEEQHKRTEKAIEKMSKEIDKMSREIRNLTDGWGRFVEALVAPAIPKILRKRFGIKNIGVALNCKRQKNGKTMEIDVLITGNGRKNEDIVIISSIKSRLPKSDIIDFVDNLKKFHIFFPEYKNYKLQGLVGGIRIDEGVDKYAEGMGLYVLGSSGEAVELLNKPGFKPKLWR